MAGVLLRSRTIPEEGNSTSCDNHKTRLSIETSAQRCGRLCGSVGWQHAGLGGDDQHALLQGQGWACRLGQAARRRACRRLRCDAWRDAGGCAGRIGACREQSERQQTGFM